MCYICRGPSCNQCGQYDGESSMMSVRMCPGCGKEIRAILAKCPYCGHAREQNAPAEDASQSK